MPNLYPDPDGFVLVPENDQETTLEEELLDSAHPVLVTVWSDVLHEVLAALSDPSCTFGFLSSSYNLL